MTKYDLTLTLAEGQPEEGVCAFERSKPKTGAGQILKLYPEHFSSYVNLNMGVNDKVRTDLDLHKWSNLGIGMYAIERSYPKVGVGQIWKQYLK